MNAAISHKKNLFSSARRLKKRKKEQKSCKLTVWIRGENSSKVTKMLGLYSIIDIFQDCLAYQTTFAYSGNKSWKVSTL